ncbi:hypothetical protein AB1N83_008143 [Pleurotus pulmonarius]
MNSSQDSEAVEDQGRIKWSERTTPTQLDWCRVHGNEPATHSLRYYHHPLSHLSHTSPSFGATSRTWSIHRAKQAILAQASTRNGSQQGKE